MGFTLFGRKTGDKEIRALFRRYETGIVGLDYEEAIVFENLEPNLTFRRGQVFNRFQGIVDQVAGDGHQIKISDCQT